MADARVYTVEPGSLIVLRGVEFEDLTIAELMDGLERACGHRKFVILQVNDGDTQVFGPDDLVAWLQAALGVDVDLARPPAAVPRSFDGGRIEFGGDA